MKGESQPCPDTENYDVAVLNAGIRLFGFEEYEPVELYDITLDANENFVSNNGKLDDNTIVQNLKNAIAKYPDEFIGFLVHLPSHWATIRKLENGNLRYLDSLHANQTSIDTIDNLFNNHLKNANVIFPYKRTGITTDLTKLASNIYFDISKCTQEVQTWFNSIKSKVVNNEIPKKDVDEFFKNNPSFNLDRLRECISYYSKASIFIPKKYVVPRTSNPASARINKKKVPGGRRSTLKNKEYLNKTKRSYLAESDDYEMYGGADKDDKKKKDITLADIGDLIDYSKAYATTNIPKTVLKTKLESIIKLSASPGDVIKNQISQDKPTGKEPTKADEIKYKRAVKNLEDDLQDKTDELSNLNAKLTTSNTEKTDLSANIATLTADLATAKTSGVQANITKIQDELKEKKKDLADLNTVIDKLNPDIRKLNKEIKTLQKDLIDKGLEGSPAPSSGAKLFDEATKQLFGLQDDAMIANLQSWSLIGDAILPLIEKINTLKSYLDSNLIAKTELKDISQDIVGKAKKDVGKINYLVNPLQYAVLVAPTSTVEMLIRSNVPLTKDLTTTLPPDSKTLLQLAKSRDDKDSNEMIKLCGLIVEAQDKAAVDFIKNKRDEKYGEKNDIQKQIYESVFTGLELPGIDPRENETLVNEVRYKYIIDKAKEDARKRVPDPKLYEQSVRSTSGGSIENPTRNEISIYTHYYEIEIAKQDGKRDGTSPIYKTVDGVETPQYDPKYNDPMYTTDEKKAELKSAYMTSFRIAASKDLDMGFMDGLKLENFSIFFTGITSVGSIPYLEEPFVTNLFESASPDLNLFGTPGEIASNFGKLFKSPEPAIGPVLASPASQRSASLGGRSRSMSTRTPPPTRGGADSQNKKTELYLMGYAEGASTVLSDPYYESILSQARSIGYSDGNKGYAKYTTLARYDIQDPRPIKKNDKITLHIEINFGKLNTTFVDQMPQGSKIPDDPEVRKLFTDKVVNLKNAYDESYADGSVQKIRQIAPPPAPMFPNAERQGGQTKSRRRHGSRTTLRNK